LIESTGGGVLVEPGSIESLADGIEGLLRDRARRLELGRRGREVVAREYSSDRSAQETEAIWAEALASAPARARTG
jgi:glycosyltransferase involved in cell wall biosynthesis